MSDIKIEFEIEELIDNLMQDGFLEEDIVDAIEKYLRTREYKSEVHND